MFLVTTLDILSVNLNCKNTKKQSEGICIL